MAEAPERQPIALRHRQDAAVQTKAESIMSYDPSISPGPAPLSDFYISTRVSLKGDVIKKAKQEHRLRPPSDWPPRLITSQTFHEIRVFQGLRVLVEENGTDGVSLRGIHGKISEMLYGANGCVPNEPELLRSLDMVIHLLQPFLALRGDYYHLIPGLAYHSRAFWYEVTIALQLRDPREAFESCFTGISHPDAALVASDEDFGSTALSDGARQLEIYFYRQDRKLAKLLFEYEDCTPPPVFRVDVRLAGTKLVQYLGRYGTLRRFVPGPKLVGFTGLDLCAAHREICLRLQIPDHPIIGSLGSRRSEVDEASLARSRFLLVQEPVAPDDPVRSVAALVFAPENYLDQPDVAIPDDGCYVSEPWEEHAISALVAARYGSGNPIIAQIR